VNVLERALERESTVYAACAATLAIGLCFIFIRAPHPWGIEGFDHYHDLALMVASGRPFPTLDVPWGYAYFLAAFYRTLGDHPVAPLAVQALLNALVPWLVYRIACRYVSRPTAILSAILAGLFSFNTVYASTQSSDALCTVIFLAAILAFIRGLETGRLAWFAAAGVLTGLAPQFRPNLILVPLLLAAYLVLAGASGRRAAAATVVVAGAVLALMPWIVRNYRLTRMIIPASVHSGVQLWYGTLQVGPYLNSRAYNPRSLYESGVFDYTSLDYVPLVVVARGDGCKDDLPARMSLVYWTSRHAVRSTAEGVGDGTAFTFEVPAPAAPAAFYYYVTTTDRAGRSRSVPDEGPRAPLVYFVSRDHLGDLDTAGDLLDVFDLVRIMRHLAWDEPLRWADRLRGAGLDDRTLQPVVRALARRFGDSAAGTGPLVRDFRFDGRRAIMTLADGSTVAVARGWRERLTDIDFSGGLAASLMSSTESLQALTLGTPRLREATCIGLDAISINSVFYRREPHLMGRYTALALDNIERAPVQFALAALFRVGRLFIVWGTADAATTQQFRGGRALTMVATALSAAFVVLFVAGAVVAWRSGRPVGLLLLLIAYVPVTIAPMLNNMRYTVTVQPLMLIFAASAIMSLRARAAARVPSDTRTAPLL
jgi:hypothetical protein